MVTTASSCATEKMGVSIALATPSSKSARSATSAKAPAEKHDVVHCACGAAAAKPRICAAASALGQAGYLSSELFTCAARVVPQHAGGQRKGTAHDSSAPRPAQPLFSCTVPGAAVRPTSAARAGRALWSKMADADTVELSAEALLDAIKQIKAANPEFGIKRVWQALKETKGMEVSEKRVKKFMQENGMTEGGGAAAAEGSGGAGEAGEETPEQRKKKAANKRQKEKAKEKAAFEEWCQKVLADSAHLVAGVSEDKRRAMPYEFTNYEFSGPLRPAYVTAQATVPDDAGIPKPDYAETSDPVSERAMRGNHAVDCKEGDDAEGMRLAGRYGREVIDIAGRFLKVGVTGDEIDRIVHAASLERKCYPSPLNYYRFPKSVCVSPNEVICHGIPDCRPIEDGDIVNLDVTVYVEYKGKRYHGDLNETYLVGNCNEDSVKLVKCAYDCLKAACDMIKPGTMYRDLGAAIAQVAAQNGCSVVKVR